MKISIITVCYNSAMTIEKTIQSVAAQTYKNIEYIIIDGNSKDGTIDIVKKYEEIITIWISELDKGLYDAINKGIELATGDLMGILNSDDVFAETTVLENIAKFHEEHTVDASISNIVQTNEGGRVIRLYTAKNWNPKKLTIGFMPPHPAIFFKRELFAKLGNYQLDFKIGADYELITRYFLKHQISWKYLDLTTTSMLVGGLSSSGMSSYQIISKEIKKALTRNDINFSYLKIHLRGCWKLMGLLYKKEV